MGPERNRRGLLRDMQIQKPVGVFVRTRSLDPARFFKGEAWTSWEELGGVGVPQIA
jgi:hypothetical protein